MAKQSEADKFFAWRDAERRKHRTMTLAEYQAWCNVGDIISHPSDANAFAGGLTIIVGPTSAGIFGKTSNR